MPAPPQVTIYTDGACLRNPGGAGGCAAVLMFGAVRKEISAGFRSTTNNRMEMMAVLMALQSLKRPCDVTLFSDSEIIVGGVNKGAPSFRFTKSGAQGKLRPNADLWERIRTTMVPHTVRAIWVRGHTGNAENERCDRLADTAARGCDLAEDSGYNSTELGLT
jgi:ribonuclease HI